MSGKKPPGTAQDFNLVDPHGRVLGRQPEPLSEGLVRRAGAENRALRMLVRDQSLKISKLETTVRRLTERIERLEASGFPWIDVH